MMAIPPRSMLPKLTQHAALTSFFRPGLGQDRRHHRARRVLLALGSCPGITPQATASGVHFASHGAGGLWIVPISMATALIVLLSGKKAASERSDAAIIAILSGLANVVVLLYYLAQFNGVGQRDDFGLNSAVRQAFRIEIGAMLSFFGSIGVFIGGLIYRNSATKVDPKPGASQRTSTIPP